MIPVIGSSASLRRRFNGYRLLANAHVDITTVTIASAGNIPFDIINEDYNMGITAPVTNFVAPVGSLFGILTISTFDQSSANNFYQLIMFNQLDEPVADVVFHNGYYATAQVSRVVPCVAGDSFRIYVNAGVTLGLDGAVGGFAFYG
jgi:hypothetical protein